VAVRRRWPWACSAQSPTPIRTPAAASDQGPTAAIPPMRACTAKSFRICHAASLLWAGAGQRRCFSNGASAWPAAPRLGELEEEKVLCRRSYSTKKIVAPQSLRARISSMSVGARTRRRCARPAATERAIGGIAPCANTRLRRSPDRFDGNKVDLGLVDTQEIRCAWVLYWISDNSHVRLLRGHTLSARNAVRSRCRAETSTGRLRLGLRLAATVCCRPTLAS